MSPRSVDQRLWPWIWLPLLTALPAFAWRLASFPPQRASVPGRSVALPLVHPLPIADNGRGYELDPDDSRIGPVEHGDRRSSAAASAAGERLVLGGQLTLPTATTPGELLLSLARPAGDALQVRLARAAVHRDPLGAQHEHWVATGAGSADLRLVACQLPGRPLRWLGELRCDDAGRDRHLWLHLAWRRRRGG